MRSKSLPFDFAANLIVEEPSANASQQNDSEGQIWLDFIRGSDAALGRIYRSYANMLYNYGRQFTHNNELVLDAVQDVFCNLIRNRKNLGIAVSVKLYLYAALRRNLVRQIKRSNKIILQGNLSEDNFQIAISPNQLFLNPIYSAEQRKIIEQACNRLPATQREALILHYLEGFSYKEISEIMEVSKVKSVRAMIYRALDTLSLLMSRWKDKI